MAESACLMPAFSCASSIPIEAKQENPMHALGDSISFGRFMSESLAWEKWSTFSHKRYVEEAERYAQPGSVAQKKAFFEAHYKKIAAKKAAALLEQANTADSTVEPEFEGRISNNANHDLDSEAAADGEPEVKNPEIKVDSVVTANGYNPKVKPVDLEVGTVGEIDSVREDKAVVVTTMKEESSSQLANDANNGMISESELNGTLQTEKPALKSSSSNEDVSSLMSKKKPILPSLKSSASRGASKVPSSPAKHIGPVLSKKETNVTPITRKSTIDSKDEKRSTPNSLSTLINFMPTKEPDKSTNPAIRKIDASRVAPTSHKASKDSATPLRTPTMASIGEVPKYPSGTPCSENRRAKTPLDPSASGSKATGPKWHILSAVSKSLIACRNKLQSPSLSAPFSLRTEERAARRKQKLEEKFNAKDAEKVQLQTKLKEKAETELRKLRQSLCFKARPLPNFYRERETPNNQTKKTLATSPQSPRLGRKPMPSTKQSTMPPPFPTSSTKNNAFKNILKKNGRSTSHPLTSLPDVVTYENKSPNIQH